MVAYVPAWSGAATTPRWALLSVGVAAAVMLMHFRPTALHAVGGVALACAALTLAWTPNLACGLWALWTLLLFAGLFMIGAELPSLRPVYIGAALGIGINSLFALIEWAGFSAVYHIDTSRPAGLFMNGNYLAEPAVLVLVGLIGYRLWCFVPLVLPSVILPMCRGAFVALGVAGILALPRRWRFPIAVMAVLAGLALAGLLPLGGARAERIIIWTATLDGLTWWGNGLGSFYSLFPSHATGWDFLLSRPVHAHNDILELTYDLGLGVMPALAFLAVALLAPWRTEHFVLTAFLVEGCFGFPLHFPATVLVAGLAAGGISRDRAHLRDVLHARGMALCDGMERLARSLGARRPRRDGRPAVSS